MKGKLITHISSILGWPSARAAAAQGCQGSPPKQAPTEDNRDARALSSDGPCAAGQRQRGGVVAVRQKRLLQSRSAHPCLHRMAPLLLEQRQRGGAKAVRQNRLLRWMSFVSRTSSMRASLPSSEWALCCQSSGSTVVAAPVLGS